jgi:hypothetical protein
MRRLYESDPFMWIEKCVLLRTVKKSMVYSTEVLQQAVHSLRAVPKELPWFQQGRLTRFETGSLTVEQLLGIVYRVLGDVRAQQVLGGFTAEQLLAEANRLQQRPWVLPYCG